MHDGSGSRRLCVTEEVLCFLQDDASAVSFGGGRAIGGASSYAGTGMHIRDGKLAEPISTKILMRPSEEPGEGRRMRCGPEDAHGYRREQCWRARPCNGRGSCPSSSSSMPGLDRSWQLGSGQRTMLEAVVSRTTCGVGC